VTAAPPSLTLLTHSADETEAVGARLARSLPSRAAEPAVVYLSGELGAGKTTLARGFMRARGVSGAIKSPTYTLIECHQTGPLVIVHLDLYRLQGPADLEGLGLRDLMQPGHLWLIEWPERGAGRLPAADVQAVLTVAADHHRVEISAASAFGREWLAGSG